MAAMPDLPTRTDLFDAGAREGIARSNARAPSKRLSPKAFYTEGSDINIVVAGASAMAEEVLRQATRADTSKWLDSASYDDLDRLVLDRTSRGLPRKGAAPAYAPVTFLRLEGTLPSVNLSAGTLVQTATQVQFELLSNVALPSGATGPVTVTARAVLAGTEANLGESVLTELVSSPDPEITVTNLDVAAGGYDREPDGAYRERARAFFRNAPRGTVPAIELGARSVAGIAFATVEEQVDASGDPTGFVFVYVGDVNGQANQALVTRVKYGLREYRAAGIPPVVIGSIPEYISYVIKPRFVAGYDPESVLAQLQFAIVALVNQTQPNLPVEFSLLMTLARRVPGLLVRDDLFTSPTGDVYPSATGRCLRTTLDRITLAPA